MKVNYIFCATIFVCMYLLSACSPGVVQSVQERYFFPPEPNEPKIEYLQSYFSDKDLKSEEVGFFTKYVLGEFSPRSIFSSPVDVVSNGQGKVYVTDSGARAVFVLDLTAGVYRPLRGAQDMAGEGSPMFAGVMGVDLDDRGRIYVTDVVSRSVFVFDENEMLLLVIKHDDLKRPTAVAVDPERDRIYVLDTSMHRIVQFNLRGDLQGFLGARGDGEGEFNFPTDLDLDSQGYLYVLDTLNARVQVFDAAGLFVRSFGERGTASGSFSIPKNIAVSDFGQVYVTDALSHKLVIFSREGDFLLRIGGKAAVTKGVSPGGFYLPRGVDVDMSGGIWVVDNLNRMMHRFQFLTPEYLSRHPIN